MDNLSAFVRDLTSGLEQVANSLEPSFHEGEDGHVLGVMERALLKCQKDALELVLRVVKIAGERANAFGVTMLCALCTYDKKKASWVTAEPKFMNFRAEPQAGAFYPTFIINTEDGAFAGQVEYITHPKSKKPATPKPYHSATYRIEAKDMIAALEPHRHRLEKK